MKSAATAGATTNGSTTPPARPTSHWTARERWSSPPTPRPLHRALVEDEHITSFNVFGYQAPPRMAAGNLRGARLWGNVNPMLMLNGSKAEVMRACLDCLEAMAPGGGFMLGDGANVCPDTPLENLAVFTEAAEAYGMPAEMSNAGE